MRFVKFVSLVVWHIEPDEQLRTLCGQKTPAIGSRHVARVERPATELKICRLCAKGVQLQLKTGATPAAYRPGRWP